MHIFRRHPPLLVLLPLLVACGGNVVVDADQGDTSTTSSMASSGTGAGGAAEFCGNICEQIIDTAGPYCGHVDVCTNDCVKKWHGSEAKGCVDELIASWECILAGVQAGDACPVICEEEQGAWFDCKNQ